MFDILPTLSFGKYPPLSINHGETAPIAFKYKLTQCDEYPKFIFVYNEVYQHRSEDIYVKVTAKINWKRFIAGVADRRKLRRELQ